MTDDCDDTGAPWLVLDRREGSRDAPGLHALLIGVSEYEKLPDVNSPPSEATFSLQRLTFAAASASLLREKLEALDDAGRLERRLKTIRLLTAPSALESASGGPAPTIEVLRTAIKAWRADVAQNRQQSAFFYFAGHGIRTDPEDSVLLASDFLADDDAKLRHTFRLSNIRNGMAPSLQRPQMGAHQYYFVDACRQTPRSLIELFDEEPEKILKGPIDKEDYRVAPVFFASPPGGETAGLDGKHSFFVRALLWALDHGSARRELQPGTSSKKWPVKAASLANAIRCGDLRFADQLEMKGKIGEATLCYAVDPPRLKVSIGIDPTAIAGQVVGGKLHPVAAGTGQVLDFQSNQVNPCEVADVPAGIYQLELLPSQTFFPIMQDPELISIDLPMPWRVWVDHA